MNVVDDFAGPGGWDLGARLAGVGDPVGVENDKHACATRLAAGLRTFGDGPVDMRDVDEAALGDVDGYIGSPPCQTFSRLAKGEGRAVIDELRDFVLDVAAAGEWTDPPPDWFDVRSSLVLYPMRRILRLHPRWVALEQTPYVLPLWESYAEALTSLGYSCWTAKVNAANYGVPQLRERAVLLARCDRTLVPPAPTHAKSVDEASLFSSLQPWVSMGEALGWTAEDRWWHERHHNQSGYDADIDWPLRRPRSRSRSATLCRRCSPPRCSERRPVTERICGECGDDLAAEGCRYCSDCLERLNPVDALLDDEGEL